MDAPTNAIGDMTALTDREFVIIERDGGQGDASDPRQTNPARFKKIFRIDLDAVDANGTLIKEEVVDLMNIYDPRDVAANGRTNTVFTFPFTTIEDVLVLDNNRLLVIDDNNYPGSNGREFGVAGQQRVHRAARCAAAGLRRGRRPRPSRTSSAS